MIKALITDVSRVLLFPKDKMYKGSLNELHKNESSKTDYHFFNTFELNEELLNFYKSLKNSLKVYILTSDVIQDDLALQPYWGDTIDKIFSASKMNTHKSKPEAYEKVLQELNLIPEEVLYVDDSEENLEAVKSVGLQTVLYKDNDQSIKDIHEILENNITDKNKVAISTYQKIADKYSNLYFDDLTDVPYIDTFLEKLPPKGRILDVGSGPGQFTKYIMDKGFEVTGIDYTFEMIKIAKQKVPSGNFKQMDMRKLEFEDENFDGLLVAYSLIHIPSEDLPKTLEGFFRVLKTNGYIEIIAQKGEANKIIDEPFMPSEKMFFNFFTKERLSNLLEDAGFKVVYQEETQSQDPDSVSDKVIYTIAQK